MIWKSWQELPDDMRCEAVRPYYDILASKRRDLMIKSVFDRLMAAILLVVLSPIFLLLAVWIKLDSEGPVFFRQERVTQYGKSFRIYKFRIWYKMLNSLVRRLRLKAICVLHL